jgi:predicted heme/steroid binding protein
LLKLNTFVQIFVKNLRPLLKFSENLKEYTKNQLALRNGQDKDEIWVALNGLIYEVTASRLWRNGKHYEHWAGQDLTEELADAPHNEAVFEKFKVIGKLIL